MQPSRIAIAVVASVALSLTFASPAYALFSSIGIVSGGTVDAVSLSAVEEASATLTEGLAEVAWETPQQRSDIDPAYLVTRTLDGVATQLVPTVGTPASGQTGFSEDLSTPAAISDTEIVSVSNGAYHSCAVSAQGAAMCWGNNSFGQLGSPRAVSHDSTPLAVTLPSSAGEMRAISISAGDRSSCGVFRAADPLASQDGQVYCWGYRFFGITHPDSSSPPARISGVLAGKNVTAVSAGGSSSCALAEGIAYCWDHQGSVNGGWDTRSPVAVGGALTGKSVSKVSAGFTHACATTTDGEAYCWGNGADGRLGVGTTSNSHTPLLVGDLQGKFASDISAGEQHTCAIASNDAYCWGLAEMGQLGNGVAVPPAGLSPELVPLGGRAATQVSAGVWHSCAIVEETSGSIPVCWGARWEAPYSPPGTVGELFPGAAPARTEPRTPEALLSVRPSALSVGFANTCTLDSGSLHCWGLNWWQYDNQFIPSGFPGFSMPFPAAPIKAGPLLTHSCSSGWLNKTADATLCAPGPTLALSYEVSYSKRDWASPGVTAVAQP